MCEVSIRKAMQLNNTFIMEKFFGIFSRKFYFQDYNEDLNVCAVSALDVKFIADYPLKVSFILKYPAFITCITSSEFAAVSRDELLSKANQTGGFWVKDNRDLVVFLRQLIVNNKLGSRFWGSQTTRIFILHHKKVN